MQIKMATPDRAATNLAMKNTRRSSFCDRLNRVLSLFHFGILIDAKYSLEFRSLDSLHQLLGGV